MKPHLVFRALMQAEGYLELGLPERAVSALGECDGFGPFAYEGNYLSGEALRCLERYHQAVGPLREAIRLKPESLPPRLALGWCLKRTGRLHQAIEALEDVLGEDDPEAIVPFNLACYWCLAGDKAKALRLLQQALDLDPSYASHAASDVDLTDLRGHPRFRALLEKASFSPDEGGGGHAQGVSDNGPGSKGPGRPVKDPEDRP